MFYFAHRFCHCNEFWINECSSVIFVASFFAQFFTRQIGIYSLCAFTISLQVTGCVIINTYYTYSIHTVLILFSHLNAFRASFSGSMNISHHDLLLRFWAQFCTRKIGDYTLCRVLSLSAFGS